MDGWEDVYDVLAANRKHAERWAIQFESWGGHRNTYAMDTHRFGLQQYKNALQFLASVPLRVIGTPTLMCEVLSNGGSTGSIVKTITSKTGFSSTSSLSDTNSAEFTGSLEASMQCFRVVSTARAEWREGRSMTSMFQSSYHEEESTSVRLTVNLDTPCYYYTPRVKVLMADRSVRYWYGTAEHSSSLRKVLTRS